MAETKDLGYIKKARRIEQHWRHTIHPEVPTQLVQTFLTVAENEGKTVSELAELIGASKSTASRHLLDLSEKLRNGSEGYKLIKATRDPSNLRNVEYTITPRGQSVLNGLRDIMEA